MLYGYNLRREAARIVDSLQELECSWRRFCQALFYRVNKGRILQSGSHTFLVVELLVHALFALVGTWLDVDINLVPTWETPEKANTDGKPN